MQGIIDIHAHILPGLDDGAANMEEAKTMLELAYGQGIRKIIATPHYKRGQNLEHIMEVSRQLQQKAYEIHKNYRIFLGQEILYSEDILEDLREKRALTMCGSNYVLVEFSPLISYTRLFQGLRKLILARYIPILAHVERYLCLREKGRVNELINIGSMLQMNYCSIAGSKLNSEVRWCRRQIQEENVHMMGTDMHHMNKRTPVIKNSLTWMRKSCSMETYQKLVSSNAQNILKKRKQ